MAAAGRAFGPTRAAPGRMHNVDMLLGDDKIVTVDSVKDLDSKLKFFKYIGNSVARAHARSNLIHKCFLSRNVQTLTRAFTVYVRRLLEYGSCVWSPHFKSEIDRIESVQRRFTKRLRLLNNISRKFSGWAFKSGFAYNV